MGYEVGVVIGVLGGAGWGQVNEILWEHVLGGVFAGATIKWGIFISRGLHNLSGY